MQALLHGGLSRLHALTLVAQFITLYGGPVLIVKDYIKQQLAAANQRDSSSGKLVIIYALVYLCNCSVVCWPAVQVVLLNSPAEVAAEVQSKVKAPASGKFSSNSDDEDGSDNEQETSSASSEATSQVMAIAQAGPATW